MFKKILKRQDGFPEYVGEVKITYLMQVLEVVNYHKLLNIYDKEVILEKILISGENLKVVYQDPVTIKIKGKIKTISMRNENEL